jgi:predicted nuclease with TOPRIM domain
LDRFKVVESTIDPNISKLLKDSNKIHKFQKETVNDLVESIHSKLNSDQPEYQQLINKIKVLDFKVDNMIPRINFTFKDNKNFKIKINKLKDTINQMSTTFNDS